MEALVVRYLSVDTETLGVDFYHGAKPFFFTFCDDEQNQTCYEWNVNPENRAPEVDESDLDEMEDLMSEADTLVLQGGKFDVSAFASVRPRIAETWPWPRMLDTLRCAHLLASNQPHDLTTLAIIYIRENIQPYEDALEVATKRAQSIARSKLPTWRVAKKGEEDMPSAKGKVWKFDGFLPRAFCRLKPELLGREFSEALKREWQQGDDPMLHPWATVLSTYGNWDSTVTVPVMLAMLKIMKERGLEKIYAEVMKQLEVAYAMEKHGVTINKHRLDKLFDAYTEEADRLHKICINLADGEIEKLPVTGVSNALRRVVFEKFGLVSNKKTDTGNPSMDKYVLEYWASELDPHSKACRFVTNLRAYRQRATALSYMKGYKRFWLPLGER